MSSEHAPRSTNLNSLRALPATARGTLAPVTLAAFALAHGIASAAPATPEPFAAPVEKDTGVTELPELTVESQRQRQVASPKFTAPLVETPQTVSVIPKDIFNEQGATSLADVLGNTPGITFLAGEGGHVSGSNSFVMRGFDANGSIFIDGVRDNGNYSREIYNLEQVEVVKGPAGDNGRGSAGGYINLSTKSPQLQDFGSAAASFGFDHYADVERLRTTLDLNKSLDAVLPGAAFRLNLLWQDGGVAGRDYALKKNWGISPSIAFGLGKPTRLFLSYQHDKQDNRPEYGALAGSLANTATAVRPSRPVDRAEFYGLLSDYENVDLDVLTARIEHDLSPTIRLSNNTRFSQTSRDAIYTVPGALDNRPSKGTTIPYEMVTTTRQAFWREIETLNNQTNIAAQFSTGKVDHSFAGGLELIREKGHTLRDWTGLGTSGDLTKTVNVTTAGVPTTDTVVTGTSPYNPDPARAITDFAPTYRFIDDIQIDTVALYAFDTAKITERWQATGGLRVENYEATYDVYDRTPPNPRVLYKADDTIVTGKLGIVYKPATNGSVYAAWSVAAQPPGTNNLSNDNGSRNNGTPGSTGQNSPNAEPQKSYNYEVGTKWDLLSRRLSTSLAFFKSERKNISVATDTNGVPTVYGDQEVQGVELSVSGRITPNWIIFGGVSYLDSENHNSTNAVQDGTAVNWTPEYSGNLWTTYRLPFGLTIGGGAQYTGASNVSLNNTSTAELPSRCIWNAMASYEITRTFSVRVNVNNVFDEFYARAINNNSNRAYYGDPRNYQISALLKF